jgi:hypothetical protein
MRSTFKITFYVNKGKEKNGLVPVLGRITINGSIAQFSCKQSTAPPSYGMPNLTEPPARASRR